MSKMSLLAMMVMFFTLFVLIRSRPRTERYRRMIGGKEVDIKKWTYLVQLKFLHPSARWKICSATIIDKSWLLTAAHCVDDLTDKTKYLQVKIAQKTNPRDRKTENEWTMSSYRVKQIVVHPQHNHISYFSWNDDIALIELTQPVPDYIKVASIPDVGVKLRKCKSAGWGSTKILQNGALDVANKNYDISKTLQEIKVPLLPWSQCKDTYSKTHEEFAKRNDKVFCAGAIGTKKRHKQGGCIGDSGSPLICDSPKGKVISGIMLGGNPHCLPGQNYMVFTDASKHKLWITQTIT